MTLQGTLTDLGIVDLVQFPHAGRKTGELIVVSAEHHARLYYRGGRLVHAVMDDYQGQDVLVELFGLEEGEFEFRQDIQADEVSIEGDLHLAVMQALKIRDERKLEQERREAAQQGDPADGAQGDTMDQRLTAILDDFFSQNDYARYACVIDVDGQPMAQALGAGDTEHIEALRASIAALARDYPREGLARIFIEDKGGVAAAQQTSAGDLLLLVAEGSVSLGVVSMGVSKLCATLNDEGRSR